MKVCSFARSVKQRQKVRDKVCFLARNILTYTYLMNMDLLLYSLLDGVYTYLLDLFRSIYFRDKEDE